MKDEKILKKIDKLLRMYGVESEEERKSFLNDVQDSKYDEQEIVDENDKEMEEAPVEGEETTTPEENPTEPVETSEEPEETAEPTETPVEEESMGEETPMEEEAPVEETAESQPMEQPVETNQEDVQNTIDGLTARLSAAEDTIKTLSDIVAKLGVPQEEESGFGTSPTNESTASEPESSFKDYVKLRKGR